jgi:C1A family cysteine protease
MTKIISAERIDVTQDPQLNKQYNPNYKEPVKIDPKTIKIPRYNWIPDKFDARDFKYQIVPTATANRVDLRPYCVAIQDQGQLGSCTANAIAGAIEYLDKKNNKLTYVSRLYIYYYERLLEGTVNYDSGAYIRDGIRATYTYGASQESLWPYNISKYKIKPSDVAIADAAKRKVTLYERALNFDACINAIANGFPVTVGFYVYSSFESGNWWYTTGLMPYPNTSRESLLGGHAVLLVGYDKTNNYFIARNSWGTNWGLSGYFYMPFQVIQNTSMSSDFWVIKSVNNQ